MAHPPKPSTPPRAPAKPGALGRRRPRRAKFPGRPPIAWPRQTTTSAAMMGALGQLGRKRAYYETKPIRRKLFLIKYLRTKCALGGMGRPEGRARDSTYTTPRRSPYVRFFPGHPSRLSPPAGRFPARRSVPDEIHDDRWPCAIVGAEGWANGLTEFSGDRCQRTPAAGQYPLEGDRPPGEGGLTRWRADSRATWPDP